MFFQTAVNVIAIMRALERDIDSDAEVAESMPSLEVSVVDEQEVPPTEPDSPTPAVVEVIDPPERGVYAFPPRSLEMPHLTPVRVGQRIRVPAHYASGLRLIIAKLNDRPEDYDHDRLVYLRPGSEPERAMDLTASIV